MASHRSTELPGIMRSAFAMLFCAGFLAACMDSPEPPLGLPDEARTCDTCNPNPPGGGGGGGRGGGGGPQPPPPFPEGERLFKEETFGGNGRTCATCHRNAGFTIMPSQIANLDADDPLFVGKLDITPGFIEKALFTSSFPGENPGDPPIVVHRRTPGVFFLTETAPYMSDARAATLRDQILEAVFIHAHDGDLDDSPTKRMPTDAEIQEMINFMLGLIQPQPPAGVVLDPERVARGEELFFGKAQCVTCHAPPLFTDNLSHDIGIQHHPFAPAGMPFDPGVCRINPSANDCAVSGQSFVTRHLIGVRSTRPFFHNGVADTLFPVLQFYAGNLFRNSPAFQRLGLEAFTLTQDEQIDLHDYIISLSIIE